MNTKAEKTLSDVRTKLVLQHPFFAAIALGRKYEETDQIPTMATDGYKILYNPEFVNKLTFQEVTGVVVHEMYHILLMHMIRLGDRNPMIANIAMDYAINPLVQQAGFVLPKTALLDKKYDNMEWEAIYALLIKNAKQITLQLGGGDGEGKEKGNFEGNVGGVLKPKKEDGSALSSGEMKKLENDIKQTIQGAFNAAKKIGNIPAGMERLVKELLEPIVNWKAVMQEFIVTNSRNDYSWSKPNKRYIQSGFVLPSLEKPEIGDIVIGIDTSGSMTEKDLQDIASELQGILHTFNTRIIVIYCDTQAYPHEEYTGDDIVSLRMVGGGGTAFDPVFDYVEKNGFDPVALIYFTDGYGNKVRRKAPDYKVLWVLNNKIDESYYQPWGERVTMIREQNI